MVRVVANGTPRDVAAGTTLIGLLGALDLLPDNVAVEHNGEALARSQFGDVVLEDGDRLEIVKAVSGGSDPIDAPARLATARLYLCCGPRPYDWLARVCEAGVDIIQLRDKESEAGPQIEAAGAFRAVADATGALFVMNDRADVALATAADGVHLGQDDLPIAVARTILGPAALVGRSTHDPSQAERAAAEDCDYFCAGPVWATPTKEGRPAAGVGVVQAAARLSGAKPWFAIGGIDESNLAEVVAAGATRVVVVRAITEAADPVAAVRRLREALP